MPGTWPLLFVRSARWRRGLARPVLRCAVLMLVCVAGSSAGLPYGCTSAGSAPNLTGLTPASGYNDAPLPVVLEGEGFRPSLSVSATAGVVEDKGEEVEIELLPEDGGPAVRLRGAHVQSPTAVEAEVPANLPMGTYALTFDDNRGHRVSLPAAFTSLGPDLVPPVVELVEPTGTSLFADQRVTFVFKTEDASPPVLLNLTDERSMVSTFASCPCVFTRTTPVLADGEASTDYAITARGLDARGNRTNQRFGFRIVPRPELRDFAPRVGPIAGGTSVALTGAQIPEDAQIYVDDVPLVPNGGERAPDGSSIRGWTPAHPKGTASIVLRSAAGEIPISDFTFIAAPTLSSAQPPSLPTNDGCHVVQLVGDPLPLDGTWFVGHDGTDRVVIPSASIDPTDMVVRLCVPTAFGTGPASFFLDSPSAGAVRIDDLFSFEDSAIEATTPAASCPCPP